MARNDEDSCESFDSVAAAPNNLSEIMTVKRLLIANRVATELPKRKRDTKTKKWSRISQLDQENY
ncbi:hypothetical protein CCACVL1_01137 [Corchorus capsularis]|uniref:Uncharacterized protein n=1 Tax=Corchorus capsularis TaxID=210143 RepID=A0A1R3KMG1_COCAP|nr:hypothetical protein CCACVL1_01137 [Corchorus capsularis]